MLLCIDIGNTSISFGTFEVSPNGQPKLIFSSEISSCERRSTDEYAVLFKEIFSLKSSVQGAIDPIDAVAPYLLLYRRSPTELLPRRSFSRDVHHVLTLSDRASKPGSK